MGANKIILSHVYAAVNLSEDFSAFYTRKICAFYIILRLAVAIFLCYIVVRKGDTNVQVITSQQGRTSNLS